MLKVNEIFGPVIQGEGGTAGLPAMFVRFSGCNKKCDFCDTDFKEYTEMTPNDIYERIFHNSFNGTRLVVITGGEPLIQNEELLIELCSILKRNRYILQIETNGTIDKGVLEMFDYISCSPKVPFDELKIKKRLVSWWKILYPYMFDYNDECKWKTFANKMYSTHQQFYIQPIDGVEFSCQDAKAEVKRLGHPWRLGIQLHKVIGDK